MFSRLWLNLSFSARQFGIAAASAVCLLLSASGPAVFAQDGDDDPIIAAGVAVDANGVLQRLTVNDPTGQLTRQRVRESLARLDSEITQRSALRKVSLTRLSRLIN